MAKLFFPLWLLFTAVLFPSSSTGIMFQKERIDAVIRTVDTLEIRGIYWFVNEDASATSAAIYYPFPIDSFSAYPHYITVTRLPKKKPVRFDTLPEGIRWEMTLAAKGGDSVLVVYRQRIGRMQGRYIVTTAKLWGRPLQSAKFSVTVPPGLILDYWSYKYDTLYTHMDTLIYHSRYAPFSPEVDMLIRWRCK
jgi:hypothetical protein